MIAVEDPDVVLGRFWLELRADPRLSGLMALVPTDRKLGIADGFSLLPVVLASLSDPAAQLRALDAATRAYVRAAGLHISEE